MESESGGPYRDPELPLAERLATQRHVEQMAEIKRLTSAVASVASGVAALPFYLYAIALFMNCMAH